MEAFDRLVDECQRQVFTYASYLLGRPEDAEDVTQEAFMKLWTHWEELDPDRVPAWLMRVTRNLCFDRLRHVKVVREHVADSGEVALGTAPDPGPSPASTAEGAQLRERLEGALGTLGEPMRSVVLMREVQGFKYREIAEILELPLNTVRVYLHRGRRRIREHLQELAPAGLGA
ncbi:MAG: sigma-70 family RNA polymerase sigma factor [Thermoanaerobaculia bacterium]